MCNLYFYPRSPCGERPGERTSIKPIFRISIHALLAESDTLLLCSSFMPSQFLSTLSLRRATVNREHQNHLTLHFYPRSPCGERPLTDDVSTGGEVISIHALLAESDTSSVNVSASGSTFLSTLSLRRATINGCNPDFEGKLFLSTLSLRRATLAPKQNPTQKAISIHALLAESDR